VCDGPLQLANLARALLFDHPLETQLQAAVRLQRLVRNAEREAEW
jgi:hypothetical protein